MNNNMKFLRVAFVAIILNISLFASSVFAQGDISLHLGDEAPALQYSKWIKGTPIEGFKKDGLYVMEFWATWCGPCIGSMPHLSDLADQYKDKATFISANVWEKVGDKPYESALPNVIKFVDGNAKNMRFNVIADNNEQYLFKTWLQAAGIRGIPSTFVVHKGKIVWIGHPMKLDEVLAQIVAGNYDFAANKEAYEKHVEAQAQSEAEQRKLYKPLIDAREAKDYKRMLVVIDSMQKVSPEMKANLSASKFMALLNTDQGAALAFAKQQVAENPRAGADLALTLSSSEGLSKELYQFGAEQLKNFPNTNSMVPHVQATLHAQAGDYADAAAAEQKAIELVKAELKNPQFEGRVFAHTLTDYENKLKEYQSKTKN